MLRMREQGLYGSGLIKVSGTTVGLQDVPDKVSGAGDHAVTE